MINKVTNTHCRSKIIFFLLTLYKSIKNFLLGTSNAIFFTSAFFNGYRRRSGKWCFGARPVGKMNTKFCFFMSRCCIFFLSSWFFIRDKSKANTIDWKHLKELTSKSLPWQDSRWVPSLASTFVFWMSSSRKPACPWFWLKQELRIEGEQVRYFYIYMRKRDLGKIPTCVVIEVAGVPFTKNNNKEPSDDFTPHPSACCYILNTHTY